MGMSRAATRRAGAEMLEGDMDAIIEQVIELLKVKGGLN